MSWKNSIKRARKLNVSIQKSVAEYDSSIWGWRIYSNKISSGFYLPDEDAKPGFDGTIIDYPANESEINKINEWLDRIELSLT